MEPTLSFSLAPPPNLVIQCSSCKTIVGDTAANSHAATIGASKIIAVPAASDVTVDRIPLKGALGNQACTYFHVCCSGCGSVIGRMYTEAPPEGLPLLNIFSFLTDKCTIYRLGSAAIKVSKGYSSEAGAVGVAGAIGEEPTAATADATGAAPANREGDLLARVETLEAEMLKMEGMILLHDGQLQTLSGYPAAAEGGML